MLSFAKRKAVIMAEREAEKEYEAACAVFDADKRGKNDAESGEKGDGKRTGKGRRADAWGA